MSKLAKSPNLHRDLFKALIRIASITALGASVAIFSAGAPARAQTPSQEQAPAKGKVPELASAQFAWLVLGVTWFDPPPGVGRGPIKQDPAYPYHGNRDGPGSPASA
jgi:hypothetical protein